MEGWGETLPQYLSFFTPGYSEQRGEHSLSLSQSLLFFTLDEWWNFLSRSHSTLLNGGEHSLSLSHCSLLDTLNKGGMLPHSSLLGTLNGDETFSLTLYSWAF